MIRVTVILFLTCLAAAGEAPYGSKDFYPSPTRPAGYRGDGNGYFPGATPVSEWWSGTPVAVKIPNPPHGPIETFKAGDDKAKNIVWRAEMPGWANSTPIVVGDRVITLADPCQTVCVDAQTGKILWTAAANPWEVAGVEKGLADRLMQLHQIYLDGEPYWEAMSGRSTMTRIMPETEIRPIVDIYKKSVQPRLIAELKKLDPSGPWDKTAAEVLTGLEAYLTSLAKADPNGKPADGDRSARDKRHNLRKAIDQRIEDLGNKTPLLLDRPWNNTLGWCMASPVSDGERIYSYFGHNFVVCHDLNGKRMWGYFVGQRKRDGANCFQIVSPVLRGTVLVVTVSTTMLHGLDARTGKKLWERNFKGPSGYSIGTHLAVRVGLTGKEVDALVTHSGMIVRMSDGAEIGDLQYPEKCAHGGQSVFGGNGIVVKGACGDGFNAPLIGYRLAGTADAVTAEKVWELPKTSRYEPTATNGTVFFYPDAFYDLASGTKVPGNLDRNGSDVRIWAGNRFIFACNGSLGWGGRSPQVDNAAVQTFKVLDVTDPAKPRMAAATNLLSTKDRPRIPAMETLAKELYDLPNYCGQSFGWPAHLFYTETGMVPAGNRLFLRSVGHLYCIGDPAAPYDWNPASRPKAIADQIKAVK